MDDLDYEKHLSYYSPLLGVEAEKTAQFQHAQMVFNALCDWCAKTRSIAQHLTKKDARYYMHYGAGRRLQMIFYAYREITLIACPKRVKPLSVDEQLNLSLGINTIYMHLRGVLDNFAWCFLYEKESGSSLRRMEIDLFSEKFRALSSFSNIKQEISVHDNWNKEVKERRDPVAHRIPLYIPPSIVTHEEAELYEELTREYKFEQLSNIGNFYPCFQHHPEQSTIPLYPTLPDDMVHLIRIGNIIERSLVTNQRA